MSLNGLGVGANAGVWVAEEVTSNGLSYARCAVLVQAFEERGGGENTQSPRDVAHGAWIVIVQENH